MILASNAIYSTTIFDELPQEIATQLHASCPTYSANEIAEHFEPPDPEARFAHGKDILRFLPPPEISEPHGGDTPERSPHHYGEEVRTWHDPKDTSADAAASSVDA